MLGRVRVLALTRYTEAGPSSRYRLYQFLPLLAADGIEVMVAPLLGDWYIDALVHGHLPSVSGILAAFARRIARMLSGPRPDVIWIEKELLPWLPWAIERRLLRPGVPVIVDLDDGHFHRYDLHALGLVRRVLGDKIDRGMAAATVVTAGSAYLAARARASGADWIELVPTAVDLARYPEVKVPVLAGSPLTIGWIGTPGNSAYLEELRVPLTRLGAEGPVRVVLVGAQPGSLAGLGGDVRVEVRPWSGAHEIADLMSFDIGVMSLPDQAFERGKCGLKLLQYMACGLPAVASPVGASGTILRAGETGYLARAPEEWLAAFRSLRDDRDLRGAMGRAGRRRVAEAYSLGVVGPRIAALFRQVAAGGVPGRNEM